MCYGAVMNTVPARGFASLIIIIALAVLVATGGYFYLAHTGVVPGFKMSQTATSTTSSEDDGWFYIKEWGIDVKRPDGMKDLIYSVDTDFSDGIGFSTIALAALARAENKPEDGIYWCDANHHPLGELSRTTTLQNWIYNPQTTVKIGAYYYVFTTPQSTCSEKKDTTDLQTKELHTLSNWFEQHAQEAIRSHGQATVTSSVHSEAAVPQGWKVFHNIAYGYEFAYPPQFPAPEFLPPNHGPDPSVIIDRTHDDVADAAHSNDAFVQYLTWKVDQYPGGTATTSQNHSIGVKVGPLQRPAYDLDPGYIELYDAKTEKNVTVNGIVWEQVQIARFGEFGDVYFIPTTDISQEVVYRTVHGNHRYLININDAGDVPQILSTFHFTDADGQ